MSILFYPNGPVGGIKIPGIAYDVKWTPVFFNQTQKAIDGSSIDVGFSQNPLHNFELTYEFLREYQNVPTTVADERTALMAFWLANNGSLGRFGFLNPSDNTVVGQRITTVAGGATAWLIQRTMAPNLYSGLGTFLGNTEPVGLVDLSGVFPVNIYLNGSLIYTLGGSPDSATVVNGGFGQGTPGAQTLVIAPPPTNGTVITMDFTFYYWCKFQDDTLDFSEFLNQIWNANSVKLQSARPVGRGIGL